MLELSVDGTVELRADVIDTTIPVRVMSVLVDSGVAEDSGCELVSVVVVESTALVVASVVAAAVVASIVLDVAVVINAALLEALSAAMTASAFPQIL